MKKAQFFYLLRRGFFAGGGGEWSTLVNAFKTRVIADGGTLESESCIRDDVKYLIQNPEPVAFTGLLNDYSGAAAAYSLRLLDNTYTGDAIVVRRASDNTTQAIGFVNNELDTTSLESFCSGTDGFVTTWHDQSGNGEDATQTTSSAQPKIVSSGSTILDGGKAAVEFSTSTRMDSASFIPSSSAGLSVFNVYSTPVDASANTQTMFLYNFGGDASIYLSKCSSTGSLNGEYYTLNFNTQRIGSTTYRRAANTQVLESEFYLSSGVNTRQNTSAINLNLANAGSVNGNFAPNQFAFSSGLKLNSWVNNAESQNCKMQELVFYDSNESANTSGIETNINDFYTIY